ncbi:exocyst complex component 5-like [Rhopilema esculentum]|uniref:exocyst complex component 5-like n=1 Tax=Rhopilema esculentum TaxID=499914 RepID=UPI0031D5AC1B
MFAEDDFEEPYNSVNFVERVAAKVHGGGSKGGSDAFDPVKLKESFEDTIRSLQGLMKETEAKMSFLEKECTEEETKHKKNSKSVENQFKDSMQRFYELDDRINYVATKVVHLGDQLENISTPRQRIKEAQQVMKYFEEFHSVETISPIFNDPSQIHEAAAIICQLFMVAQELQTEKFSEVKYHIAEKYYAIEGDLLNKFKNAYKDGDIETMAKCANTLLPFKRYQQCYEELIDLTLANNFLKDDVFENIIPACKTLQDIIIKVFENNAEMIMSQFIQTVFDKKVQGYVYKQLSKKEEDIELYLQTFANLYKRAKDVTKKLSEFRLGSDSTFLDRLKKNAFSKYMSTYISDEVKFLDARSRAILDKFYGSIGHQKKEKTETKRIIPEGIMADMPASLQELQRKIPGRSQHGLLKESLLSQDVAINLLQENKISIRRCELISNPSELPNNISKIFKILLKYLGEDHFEYAIDMTLQVLPVSEPKSPPDLLFLKVLHEANTIFHLMEKHFTDFVLRPIGSSPVYSECAQKKKLLIEKLESKLDQGTEKILLCIAGYTKHVLNSEQKKTDFKSDESDGNFMAGQTTACKKVCSYLKGTVPGIKDSLDGKNREVVLTEFGVRFHRVLLDHFSQFVYTSSGAMTALFDINEYRHVVKDFKIQLLDRLFATMYSLMDLCIVRPENLKDVCTNEQFAGLDKAILQQFIQLRADYKSAKLAKSFI